MKNSMKISIVSSFAMLGILVSASGPVFARDITEIVPHSALVDFCADKAINSSHTVQMTLSDGTALSGVIECEEEYLNPSLNNDNNDDDKDDDDHDDKDDHDDDKDDHDDDKDDHDDDKDDHDDKDDKDDDKDDDDEDDEDDDDDDDKDDD